MVVSGNHSSAYAGRYLRPITSRATVHSSNVGYEGSESEVVLFELATFLVITSATRKSMHDLHRFEKVSNIIKQFKLSCGKCRANFKNLTVMNENFTAFLTSFTTNSFIMVITSDKDIQPAATLANLNNARERFKDLSEDGGPFGSHL